MKKRTNNQSPFNGQSNASNNLVINKIKTTSQIIHVINTVNMGGNKNNPTNELLNIKFTNKVSIINKNTKIINEGPLDTLRIDNSEVTLTNNNFIKELILLNKGNITATLNSNLPIKIIMDQESYLKFTFSKQKYFLKSPCDNFIINDPKKLTNIAIFFNTKFSIKESELQINFYEYGALREYKKMEKKIIKEFMQQNYPNYDFEYIDSLINKEILAMSSICKNYSENIFGILPVELISLIGSYLTPNDILFMEI